MSLKPPFPCPGLASGLGPFPGGRYAQGVTTVANAREHPHDHVVGFYHDDRALVAAVGDYLVQGLLPEGAVVMIATAAHTFGLEQVIREAGFSPAELRRAGRLQTFDAETVLTSLMDDEEVRATVFLDTMDTTLRLAASGGRPVRVFGELVALLWNRGNRGAALELESLWNDLATECDFSLYCGYAMAPFESPADLAATKLVCDQHSRVLPLPGMSEDRVDEAAGPDCHEVSRAFVPSPDTMRLVRQFVARVLHLWGEEMLTHDAMVVAGELATNAVVHASSPFRLSISRSPVAIRITVHDTSDDAPVPRSVSEHRLNGRGLRLVDSLSQEWGTDPEPGGKSVWAKLAKIAADSSTRSVLGLEAGPG